MTKVKKSDMIVISIVIGMITIISAFSLSAAITIPSPGNGGAVILTWISGIILGLCLVSFMMIVSEK